MGAKEDVSRVLGMDPKMRNGKKSQLKEQRYFSEKKKKGTPLEKQGQGVSRALGVDLEG